MPPNPVVLFELLYELAVMAKQISQDGSLNFFEQMVVKINLRKEVPNCLLECTITENDCHGHLLFLASQHPPFLL